MKNQKNDKIQKLFGMLNSSLYIALVTLFMGGMLTSCDGNPIDKITSLFGEDSTEVVDDEDDPEVDIPDAPEAPATPAVQAPAEPAAVLIESIGIDSKDFTLPAGKTKQLSVNVQPAVNDDEVTWKSSDVRVATVDETTGLVKAVAEGSANIIAQATGSQQSASVMVTVTPKPVASNPNYGTVNLGYGVYTGDLKNGKPHGHGTIVYSTGHKVVNSADYWAVRGDKYEGDFRDGRISGGMGYFYHNGDVVAINP